MSNIIVARLKHDYSGRMQKSLRTIGMLSDSTGNLGEHWVRALISQFPKEKFDLRVFSFIKDRSELEYIFRDLADHSPIIFHTTLLKNMKKWICELAQARGWPEYDLTGGAMIFFEKASRLHAEPNLKILHERNQQYERRFSAIIFTVQHDDGLGLATLEQADIVLLGVSRTSKTPTSIYLSDKGYKVANIPIVMGSTLHEKLLLRPHPHIIGFTLDAQKLSWIRYQRAQQEKIPSNNYFDTDQVKQELQTADRFFKRIGCPVLNVTDNAIEETAALVLKTLRLR